MKAEFWDEKYGQDDYFFGTSPHPYFKNTLQKLVPGNILLAGDGEGRHAVYAAKLGWNVTVMDYSEVGKRKAIQLADMHHVHITYEIVDLKGKELPKAYYDAVGMIYAHFLAEWQEEIHKKLWSSLKEGGHLILVGFGKDQLKYDSGGPPDKDMLYDAGSLKEQFKNAEVLDEFSGLREINEGPLLQGMADQVYLHLKKQF